MSPPAEVSSSESSLVGRVIAGRFEIVSVLGEGGMGKVYTAKDRETNQLAAIKVVHGKLSGNEEYVARLKQEARTAGRLRHDAAVRILAHGETEQGEPYLAMEYCPGRSLKEVVAKDKHLDVARACNIVGQVLGAVGAAHKQGIIHRDLKPENVYLLERAGHKDFVKVLDFGIAKILHGSALDNADLTRSGQMVGTFDYMAPEQMVGGAVTPRSDIYALGVVMYESICGDKPYGELDTPAEMLTAILSQTPPPLSTGCVRRRTVPTNAPPRR